MGIVIYPPTLDWMYMKQRPQHLMREIASAGYDVLFFNKSNRQGSVVETIGDRLNVIHHMQCYLDHHYGQLSADDKKLLWSSWSSALATTGVFQPDYTVYDCVDNFPEWESDERKWLATVDAIVCTSNKLESKMREAAPEKPIYLIPNGCEWKHFSCMLSLPGEQSQRDGQRPLIAYIGAWASWVDEKLIANLSVAFPYATTMIVGPLFRERVVECPNVVFTGYIPYEFLPELLASVNVCIIPFKLERITESTNPVKVYEYLSAGKPVVSTDLPELRALEPFVTVARTDAEFIEAIRASFQEDNTAAAERSRYARSFDWGRRLDQVRTMLGDHFPAFVPEHSPIVPNPELFSISFEMEHCTVNSYYMHVNLAHDPAFAGLFGMCRYEVFLRLVDAYVPEGYEYVYLDLDLPPENREGDLTVAWTTRAENFGKMTFANKPASHPFARIALGGVVHTTCSLDVTALVRLAKPAFPIFHVQRAYGPFLRIGRPRLTFIYRS